MSNRYRSICFIALAAGSVAITDAAMRGAAAQSCSVMRKINIGVSVAPPNVVHTSPHVAKELGFFAKRCIEPNIIQFEGGASATASAAAVQGSAIVSVGDVAIGRGMKVQQFWGLAPRMPQAYMVSAGVKTAADLKGGVIGVSTFGSESDSTVTLALQRLGYGGGMRRLEAVQSGEIKATPLNEPLASLASAQGVNVLIDLVPEQIAWVFSSIVVRRADIAQRRDMLLRFLKATAEGNHIALGDAGRARSVLAKELRITDAKILDIAYDDFRAQSPPNIEILVQGAENILAQFPGGSQKVEDYVDMSLIDALRAEGFFSGLQAR